MYHIKGRLPLMDKVSDGIDRGSSYTHTPKGPRPFSPARPNPHSRVQASWLAPCHANNWCQARHCRSHHSYTNATVSARTARQPCPRRVFLFCPPPYCPDTHPDPYQRPISPRNTGLSATERPLRPLQFSLTSLSVVLEG